MDGSYNFSQCKEHLTEEYDSLSNIDKLIIKAMNGGTTPMCSCSYSDTITPISNTIYEEQYILSNDYSRSLMLHYQLISEDFHTKNKDVKQ
jgi:hypothetical protein